MSNSARVGRPAPDFEMDCTDRSGRAWSAKLRDFADQWLLLIFYPRDFSFVCPTELTAFSAHISDFRNRNCQLLGVSADPVTLHAEWLSTNPELGGLGPLQFPLASDPQGKAAASFGVWDDEKQVSTRGLFIIDPRGTLQYAAVHNLNVGRNADEVLRVLDALQSGGLCPANWTQADGTLNLEQLLQPGRVLGHYRIRAKLGQGASGSVFAALDLHLQRMVAVKVLFHRPTEARDRLFEEARAAARLSHPNVCTIYAVEELEGLPVLVMEYLDGAPLSEVLAATPGPDLIRTLAAQTAAGLAAAHRSNLIHGDLKPANIFVTRDNVAKILDFGLAHWHIRDWIDDDAKPTLREDIARAESDRSALDPEATLLRADEAIPVDGEHADVTDTRTLKRRRGTGLTGTPAYMSPEQAAAQQTVPASDVFSFGLILYEMLTGRRALRDTKLLVLLKRLRTEDFAATLAVEVEPAYRELLGKMLVRDPALRLSMAEVVSLLAPG